MATENPPAFPVHVERDVMTDDGWRKRTYVEGGMSLRDYFAGQVMEIAARAEAVSPTGLKGEQTYSGAAARADLYADEMLKARAK